MQLVYTLPRLDQLRAVLASSSYRGEIDDDTSAEESHLSFDALRQQIPCSDLQLQEALNAIHAFELNGSYSL